LCIGNATGNEGGKMGKMRVFIREFEKIAQVNGNRELSDRWGRTNGINRARFEDEDDSPFSGPK
jgi:hypothetical protein